jgi:hypothetical protein
MYMFYHQSGLRNVLLLIDHILIAGEALHMIICFTEGCVIRLSVDSIQVIAMLECCLIPQATALNPREISIQARRHIGVYTR